MNSSWGISVLLFAYSDRNGLFGLTLALLSSLLPQSAASSLQPQSQKSTTQKAGDAISGNSNENQSSLLDKAKDTLGLNNSK